MASATKHARQVLADCEASVEELRSATQDTLRRRWLTTITLLRTVGHVLDKVDGQASAAHRAAIDAAHMELKKTRLPIFFEFIEDERNNVLKTYAFAVGGNVTIGIPAGDFFLADPDFSEHRTVVKKSRFEIRPVLSGHFVGRDPLSVIGEAVAFWHSYFDQIDRSV
jgi:hypothetical protein